MDVPYHTIYCFIIDDTKINEIDSGVGCTFKFIFRAINDSMAGVSCLVCVYVCQPKMENPIMWQEFEYVLLSNVDIEAKLEKQNQNRNS